MHYAGGITTPKGPGAAAGMLHWQRTAAAAPAKETLGRQAPWTAQSVRRRLRAEYRWERRRVAQWPSCFD